MDKKIEISKNLLNIIDAFIKKDSKADFYGTDTELHFSEIHMIKFIKENEGYHMLRIAEEMDITRGAVSQTIARLCKKGFLIKKTSEDNKSKLVIELTEKGEVAYENHQQRIDDFNGLISKLLEDKRDEDIQFVNEFLGSLNKELKL